MGFLMTLRYPGTDLELTGVRNGPASWWLSSSAKSILMRGKRPNQWHLIHMHIKINLTEQGFRLCCCTCTWPSLYCHLWRFWVSSHTLGLGKDSPLSFSFLFPLTLFWECCWRCLNRPPSCLRLQMVSCGVWPRQVSSGLRLNGSRASWSSGIDCSPTQSQNGLWGNKISKHKPNTLFTAAVQMFIVEDLEGLWAFRLL